MSVVGGATLGTVLVHRNNKSLLPGSWHTPVGEAPVEEVAQTYRYASRT